MKILPIRTDSDNREAIARIEQLWDSKAGTPERDELDVLAALVCNYERDRYSFRDTDPIDAIMFRIKEAGLKQSDLIPFIGATCLVNDILERKTTLTLNMIRKLHLGLNIPLQILVREYQLDEQIAAKQPSTARMSAFKEFVEVMKAEVDARGLDYSGSADHPDFTTQSLNFSFALDDEAAVDELIRHVRDNVTNNYLGRYDIGAGGSFPVSVSKSRVVSAKCLAVDFYFCEQWSLDESIQ